MRDLVAAARVALTMTPHLADVWASLEHYRRAARRALPTAVAILALSALPVMAQDYPPEREPLVDPFRVIEAVRGFAFDTAPDASGRIDVLFAFSAGEWSRLQASGALAMAQQVVAQWNTAAINESLPTSMRVCGVMGTTYVEGQGPYAEFPLNWMGVTGATGGRDQLWAEVTRLGCDVVHLVTVNNACGQGYVAASSLNPFSMSHRDCTVSNHSGIHEVGHVLGLHHEPQSACSQPVCTGYNYGHGWPAGAAQERDPMTYPREGGNRVLWWSSPLVTRLGQPIGIANQRDNARVIRERAAIVAGFRTAISVKKPTRPSRARVEVS